MPEGEYDLYLILASAGQLVAWDMASFEFRAETGGAIRSTQTVRAQTAPLLSAANTRNAFQSGSILDRFFVSAERTYKFIEKADEIQDKVTTVR